MQSTQRKAELRDEKRPSSSITQTPWIWSSLSLWNLQLHEPISPPPLPFSLCLSASASLCFSSSFYFFDCLHIFLLLHLFKLGSVPLKEYNHAIFFFFQRASHETNIPTEQLGNCYSSSFSLIHLEGTRCPEELRFLYLYRNLNWQLSSKLQM